ncbi:MAG TPA: hypothetical protein VLK85_07435 [Ramlibacter sp.]|nr:hypothetical protein [Ramlibacter sp.]
MRIELPFPSWADVHSAQDDAHTLTLPVHGPVSLTDRLLAAGSEGETLRIEIIAEQHPFVTLTL